MGILDRVRAYLTDADYPIKGIDVSYWQGAMNWAVAATKIQFAIIRAGYGNSYRDPKLAENVAGCSDFSIPYGLYWYVKPAKDWAKQADSLFEAYQDFGGKINPVIDLEENGGLNKSGLESWLAKLVNRFEYYAGKRVMIYTSPGFWNTAMPMTSWAKDRKLWVAHWTSASSPIIPNEWGAINNPREWEFWQHSSRGVGADYGAESRYIDLNYYRWGRAEFEAEYGVDVPTPEPPPPEPEPPVEGFALENIQPGLHVRTGPGTTYTIIGILNEGDIIQPTNLGGSSAWAEFDYQGGKAWANIQYGDDVNMVVVPPEGGDSGGSD